MTLDEYQGLAARTIPLKRKLKTNLANFALGFAGEVSEVTEPIKKHLFHGADLDEVEMAGELGDALWYLTALATAMGLALEDIAEYNVIKLKKRYPKGFEKVRR